MHDHAPVKPPSNVPLTHLPYVSSRRRIPGPPKNSVRRRDAARTTRDTFHERAKAKKVHLKVDMDPYGMY